MIEWEVADQLRIGASYLRTMNDYRTRQLAALHTRVGAGEGTSLLAEFGTNQNLDTATGDTLGSFAFLQTSTLIDRGSNLLFSFEYSIPDAHSLFRQYRAGPSFQWMPMQRLELRLDFLATRTIDDPHYVTPDDYTLQSQLHLAL